MQNAANQLIEPLEKFRRDQIGEARVSDKSHFYIGRQTGSQAHRHTGSQADRNKDRQTNEESNTCYCGLVRRLEV